MLSTRKQNARYKRSRQSDVMSDMKYLDVILGSYSRKEISSQIRGNVEDMDQRSNERQANTNPSGEDFRTLLNTNSVGSSEITSETVKMINSEITNQVSSRMNEFKVDLNLHIEETIEQVISDQVLPTIRHVSFR